MRLRLTTQSKPWNGKFPRSSSQNAMYPCMLIPVSRPHRVRLFFAIVWIVATPHQTRQGPSISLLVYVHFEPYLWPQILAIMFSCYCCWRLCFNCTPLLDLGFAHFPKFPLIEHQAFCSHILFSLSTPWIEAGVLPRSVCVLPWAPSLEWKSHYIKCIAFLFLNWNVRRGYL